MKNSHNHRQPPRILLLAESANPEWSSVPLIGWSLSRAISKVADVHLVTQIRNRGAILRAGMIEGRDFTIVDNEDVTSPLNKLSEKLRGGIEKGWTTSSAFSSMAYYSFELQMWRQLKSRIIAGEFDLVHRITPLSPTSPSIIAKRLAKLDIPFVIGPLNGGLRWPPKFIDRQYSERDWLSNWRGLYKLMPAYRSTRRYASAIIAGSKHTFDEMPSWAKDKCVYIPENGVDLARFKFCDKGFASLPLRGAFVGRLVPYKGVDLLLKAAVEFLKNGQLELQIIGEGPERAHLEAMVERFDVKNIVTFHGWVRHVEVQNKLRNCDFTVLPSIREFGGGVVLESMALGLPPIVADYGGPSELVDEKTGVRVTFSDEPSLIEGLRSAIANIIRSPEGLRELGIAGRKKVEEKLTWDAKAAQILAVYSTVLSGRKNFSSLDFN